VVKEKRMTIVAGFKVHDGILLCSDTQYTGAEKVNKQKLFPEPIDGHSYVFALAGHEPNGKMAMEECQEAIKAILPERRTLKTVKSALRVAVKPIVDGYVLSRSADQRDALAFEILVGCWIPNGVGHQLFSIGRNGSVNTVKEYECFGSGSYLGHYLIRPSYSYFMPMEAMMVFAADALRCAKLYDAACGGPSSFVLVGKDGGWRSVLYDFHGAEEFLHQYDFYARELLYYAAPQNTSDDTFEKYLGKFADMVRNARLKWKGSYEAFRPFMVLPNPIAQPNPLSPTAGQLPQQPSQE
jgi:20S proteasome alpha/beta subunit